MASAIVSMAIFFIIVYRVVKKTQGQQTKNDKRAKAVSNRQSNRQERNPQNIGQNQRQTMQRQAAVPNIVERAKNNTAKYQKDATLAQMEEEHNHAERMRTTGAKEFAAAQKAAHPHDAAHVAKELAAQDGTLLGTVEDLMVKGYDGNLTFERDFLSEGMDMINSFTLQ